MRHVLRSVLLLLTVLLVLAGCSSGVGHAAEQNLGPAAEEGLARVVAAAVEHESAQIAQASAGRVRAAVERTIGRVLDGLSAEDTQQVVKLACKAKDAVEAGEQDTWQGAALAAVVNFGGKPYLRARIADLAQKLDAAQSNGDRAEELAEAGICGAAG